MSPAAKRQRNAHCGYVVRCGGERPTFGMVSPGTTTLMGTWVSVFLYLRLLGINHTRSWEWMR